MIEKFREEHVSYVMEMYLYYDATCEILTRCGGLYVQLSRQIWTCQATIRASRLHWRRCRTLNWEIL